MRKQRIWHNVLYMLQVDRKAKLNSVSSKYIGPSDFASKKYGFVPKITGSDSKLSKSVNKHEDDVLAVGNVRGKRFVVIWNDSEEILGIKSLRFMTDTMTKTFSSSHLICLLKNDISSQSKTTLAEEYPDVQFEIWLHSEQFIIPTKLNTNPKFELSSESAAKAAFPLLKKLDDLPKLIMSSIIRRYYNFPLHSVIKTTKSSRNAGEYVPFRYVIEDPIR